MPDLPSTFYQPRNGPKTSSREILRTPYTPGWAKSPWNREEARRNGEPVEIPAGQEIETVTFRSCAYSSAVMLEILINGCGWYKATETCETTTEVTWLNWKPGQDKSMDTRLSDKVETTVYLLVCPDGSVKASSAAGPKRFSIPDELLGATSHAFTSPGGTVKDETTFWKFQPPAVDRDECWVVATYVLMVRTTTIVSPGGAQVNPANSEFVPRTTREFYFNKCAETAKDEVPAPMMTPPKSAENAAPPSNKPLR
jgi:hypothetical protein